MKRSKGNMPLPPQPPLGSTGFKDEDFEISGWCKNRGNCVAVARSPEGVAVRDTKDPTKATLNFTNEEWDAFINGAKDGQFDTKL